MYILALNGQSETNEHILLKTHGINTFKQVEGVYTVASTGERIVERSYIIPALHSVAVKELAKQTKQESILHLGGSADRPATLIYTKTGRRETLGSFVEVRKVDTLKASAYTYDATTHAYFMVK